MIWIRFYDFEYGIVSEDGMFESESTANLMKLMPI